MAEVISTILRNTLMITSFVMVMMLLIEYVNVVSKGKWLYRFRESRVKQILVAALLGIIPGCLGGFAVVSLFTHNIFNFGALAACMVATFGDEAFVMFAVMPRTAIVLSLIIFAVAIITGIIVNLFVKRFPAPFRPEHFAIHSSDEHLHTGVWGNWKYNLKHLSFERAILMAGIILIIVATVAGWFEHSHGPDGMHIHEGAHIHAHDHAGHECSGHDHHHSVHGDISGIILQERWLNILFVAVSLIALFIISVVQEHFLKEHLWEHIIKGHLPKIFFWTLGVLTVLQLGGHFFDIDGWVRGNLLYIMMIAIIIGWIPESGPHIIFITLFANGTIPFSILLTNSIVQEGHAGLPLLAESKKGFFRMKVLKTILGLIAGIAGYMTGF